MTDIASSGPDQAGPADGLDVVLEAARPELYSLNAFRIAELPVDATARDLVRRQQMVEMATQAGLPVPPGPGRALPLGTPDAETLAAALQRLRDPERRLVDEFFWFWPHHLGHSRDDPALTALAQGDRDTATRLWVEQERAYSEANVSMHNLAIVAHVLALDLENAGRSRALSPQELQARDQAWAGALQRWRLLLDHEGFWSRLTARIRDLDDPRLTTGTARRLRASLPAALLSINAQLAASAAERGQVQEAKRHLGFISASGFDKPTQEQAVERAVEPYRARLRALCKAATSEAEARPEKGDEVTRRLLFEARPLLATLDVVLPAQHPTRTTLHDEVAQAALRCQIAFGNKTDNWAVSLQLLEMARPIAVGQAACDRLDENIRIVKGNLQFSQCFFCGSRPGNDKAALEVKMFGDVTRTPVWSGGGMATRVSWRQATIRVPRCPLCKAGHDRCNAAIAVGTTIGALIGLGGCAAVASSAKDATCGGIIVLVVGIFIGAGLGALIGRGMLGAGTKPEDAKNQFPPIADKLKQGWQLGEKPNQQ